jgi:hypothetical protein
MPAATCLSVAMNAFQHVTNMHIPVYWACETTLNGKPVALRSTFKRTRLQCVSMCREGRAIMPRSPRHVESEPVPIEDAGFAERSQSRKVQALTDDYRGDQADPLQPRALPHGRLHRGHWEQREQIKCSETTWSAASHE